MGTVTADSRPQTQAESNRETWLFELRTYLWISLALAGMFGIVVFASYLSGEQPPPPSAPIREVQVGTVKATLWRHQSNGIDTDYQVVISYLKKGPETLGEPVTYWTEGFRSENSHDTARAVRALMDEVERHR